MLDLADGVFRKLQEIKRTTVNFHECLWKWPVRAPRAVSSTANYVTVTLVLLLIATVRAYSNDPPLLTIA